MRIALITGLLWAVSFTGHTCAQIFLQLEKAGTLKTTRLYAGDMLTFRLVHDDKGWYERPISAFDVAGQRLIFSDVIVPLDSIEAIRLDKKAVAAQIVGTALQAGGANLILFTAYEAVFLDRNVDLGSIASGVANIVVGTALKKIFRRQVFKISPRKRLRILDLNFQ